MREGVLPCIVEEIAPYHLKRITILRIIVVMKFSECLDVPLVYGFEALFIPIGVGACAISPLVDAALYLITVGARLASKTLGCVSQTLPPRVRGPWLGSASERNVLGKSCRRHPCS